jgi:molybdopterin molybdotransferase
VKEVSEALHILLEQFFPLEEELIPITDALHRNLARDVHSAIDLPGFPNSSMDGFAVTAGDVKHASLAHPVSLRVTADIPAGKPTKVVLQNGESARIMTGAMMPVGADAVVPIEDTNLYGTPQEKNLPEFVLINRSVERGDYVRPQGQDVRRGDLILEKGRNLHPQDLGLLSMAGVKDVVVHRKPRIAILSSGDELVTPGNPLKPGEIYESNSLMLGSLVAENGSIPIYLGISPDDEASLQGIFDRAVMENVDMIISSAGVSVGAFDYIRTVIERRGEINFWRVNIRPGKPLAFGNYAGIPFFGLPGNPVSAFIGFMVFVQPVLQKMTGMSLRHRKTIQAVSLQEIQSDGRESYLRAIVTKTGAGEYEIQLTGHQGSGNLLSLVQANALLIIPSGVKSVRSGEVVQAWLIDNEIDGVR